MYKLVILLLMSIQTSRISSTGNLSETGSSTTNPTSTLPLVLMTFKDLIYAPTQLKTPSWIDNGKTLGGETRFSHIIGQMTEFMCAKEDLRNGTIDEAQISDPENHYCSYSTGFRQTDPLKCVHDAEPIAVGMDQAKPTGTVDAPSCGPENRYKMYWFGYEVCLTESFIENEDILQSQVPSLQDNPITSRKQFVVYRFCYDEDNKETLYTRHEIMSPQLLADERLEQERRRTYEIMTNGYKSFGTHYQMIKEKYNEMKNGIENAQQMVPADDLAMATWRKPTYHLLNLKLMREPLKPIWNYINELIRQNTIKDNKRILIYTRTFTAPENRPGENLQGDLQQPDIWLKVVDELYIDSNTLKSSFAGLAIILNNNPGNQFADNFFGNICEENLCEGTFSKKFPEVAKSVRCCEVTQNIKNMFDSRLTVYNLLQPDFLLENVDNTADQEEVKA